MMDYADEEQLVHTMHQFATQNNHLLPLAGESWEINPIRRERMKIWFKLESSPIFDELNTIQFWSAHFNRKSCGIMVKLHHQLDLPVHKTDKKIKLVASLAGYWIRRIEDTSRGKVQS